MNETMGYVARLMRFFKNDVSVGAGNSVRDKAPHDTWETYQDFMSQTQKRLDLYKTYDQMDYTDLVGSILDMYSEDSTPLNPEREMSVWVESKNKNIENVCNKLFIEIGLEEDITAIAREIAKYGDSFDRLVYKKGFGVLASHAVYPGLVHRKENKIHQLIGFNQDGKKFKGKSDTQSYAWDYIHYRLRGRNREGVYGWSILYNMIRPWRQLIMSEDTSLMYQLNRHPDRNLFLVDVGTSDEAEAQRTIQRFKQSVRYKKYTDPKLGKFDHRFNPITPLEDVFLGTRPNSNTRVEKLSGSANSNDISNLNYYISKLYAAARVPKRVFGFEDAAGGDSYNAKASVTNQDLKYAMNVRRVQKALKQGLRTACQIHLILKMNDPEKDANLDFRLDGNSFNVKMEPVSWLAELERLELVQLRQQVTDAFVQMGRDHPVFNGYNWVSYILRTYMHLSEASIKKVLITKEKAKGREDAAFAQETGAYSFDELKPKDKELLTSLLSKSPRLQRIIEMGCTLWGSDSDDIKGYRDVPMPRDSAAYTEDSVTSGDLIEEYSREKD